MEKRITIDDKTIKELCEYIHLLYIAKQVNNSGELYREIEKALEGKR